MDPNSEKIKQENSIDKYSSRPNILKDHVPTLTSIAHSQKPLTNTIKKYFQMTICPSMRTAPMKTHLQHILQTTDTTDLKQIFPIKLTHNKTIKLCKQRKVIRFVNYKYKIDPENYCREKILLYVPWQHNELNILKTHTTYIDAYNHFQKKITEKMKI